MVVRTVISFAWRGRGGGVNLCAIYPTFKIVMSKTINAFLSMQCYVVFVNELFNFKYIIICWFKVIRVVLDVQ